MRLDHAATPTFAHHQTFHPRFGWIKKGYTAAEADPSVFLADDATVRLGVGKNMVAAIRFWTSAFRVLEKVPSPDNSRVWHSGPTPLGRALLDDQTGYDPYFEDTATLWVLHWHLISAETDVPVWWSTFNDFTSLEFSEDQLTEYVSDEVFAASWAPPSLSSISKDVDCLLHMYAPRTARARQGIDDLLASPFRELGLITAAAGAPGKYRFSRGTKPGLSAEVLVYTCLDYLARNESDARTATLTHLANDPGTPGRLLRITEDRMHQAFLSIAEKFQQISVSSPAGAPQLVFDGDPADLAGVLLHAHYARRQPSIAPASNVAGSAARGSNPQSTQSRTKKYPNAALEAQARANREQELAALKTARLAKAGTP